MKKFTLSIITGFCFALTSCPTMADEQISLSCIYDSSRFLDSYDSSASSKRYTQTFHIKLHDDNSGVVLVVGDSEIIKYESANITSTKIELKNKIKEGSRGRTIQPRIIVNRVSGRLEYARDAGFGESIDYYIDCEKIASVDFQQVIPKPKF